MEKQNFDIVIIGSGPGGYVAAVKAAQYGFKTAVIEKSEIGGICLNWGCVPTKALLKSAEAFETAEHLVSYGIGEEAAASLKFDMAKVVERERGVSDKMRRGVEFLFKKYNIAVIPGTAKFIDDHTVSITPPVTEDAAEAGAGAASVSEVSAKYIIIATGAHPKALPFAPFDGKKIISYKDALVPSHLPKSMAVIGSGAIGSELADFYHSMGTKVFLIEFLDRIVPLEDADISAQLSRSFRKGGMKVMVSAKVTDVKFSTIKDEDGSEYEGCEVSIETKKGVEVIGVEQVLCAVGVAPNTENIGLEEIGIKTERGKIKVNDFYHTGTGNVFAIGDVIATPALAHVASAEAVACIKHIAEDEGKEGARFVPVNYRHIPGATYTSPQIASAGMTEQKAKDAGINYKVGKFMFTASGKATAAGKTDGFVKLISEAETGKLIGIHMIGADVTEIIGGMVLAMNLGATVSDVVNTVFPHPTMSEGIRDAAEAIESI